MVFQISIGMSVYECGILEAFILPLWMSYLGFVSDEAKLMCPCSFKITVTFLYAIL